MKKPKLIIISAIILTSLVCFYLLLNGDSSTKGNRPDNIEDLSSVDGELPKPILSPLFGGEGVESSILPLDQVGRDDSRVLSEKESNRPILNHEEKYMKGAMAQQLRFKHFIKNAKLSSSELKNIFYLGAQRALLPAEVRTMFSGGVFSSELDAQQYFDEKNATLTVKMKEILGEEEEVFLEESEKIQFRTELAIFSATLIRHGLALTESQRDELVDLYWLYSKAAGVNMFYSPEYLKIVSGLDFADYIRNRRLAYEMANEKAREVLNEVQLRRLKEFQDRQILGLYMRPGLPGKN